MLRVFCRSVLISCVLLSAVCGAADSDWKPLWPQGTPGATGESDRDIPALLSFPADESIRTGCGVVVCPGGGYGGLAMDDEGHQIAAWLNERGISAWILRYRLGSAGYHHPVQKGDVLRAIRTARAEAADYGVDPKRLGIWGFSAGGHLASTATTLFDEGNAASEDPVDRISSRPDFAVLCYPVITMELPFTHQGSRRNLFGADRFEDPDLIQLLSTEKQVDERTPPVFLFHTLEDQVVPVENAIRFFSALRSHGNQNSELHIYQRGRHGVGLAQADAVLRSWPDRLHDWMVTNNFTKPVQRPQN